MNSLFNLLTFLLSRKDVLEEVNADLFVGRQIEADVHGEEIVHLSFAPKMTVRIRMFGKVRTRTCTWLRIPWMRRSPD